MKILIVGGLGYVGGRLAYTLNENTEAEVYLTTRREDKNVPEWANNFHVFKMDILDDMSVERCFHVVRPDTVIHLGAADRFRCLENSQEAFDVNVGGTSRLLEKAYQEGVRRFMYFSTFHVYGELSGEITENHRLSPEHPYAESKLKAEHLIRQFHDDNRMQTVIFRLSNSYGYAMDNRVGDHAWTLVFNAFCRQAMQEGKITIQSNQYRNFIALHDVARAADYFLFTIPDEWQDGVFNLGGEECLLVSEVAQKISRVYEKYYANGPLTIETPREEREREFKPFHYNIAKVRKTGFKLSGDMEKEILGTMQLCETIMKEKA